jgi:hypothetical protein
LKAEKVLLRYLKPATLAAKICRWNSILWQKKLCLNILLPNISSPTVYPQKKIAGA